MLFAADSSTSLPFHKTFLCHSVGVGNADYSSMKKFDGDDERLTNRAGQEASRDIVQFVAMRDLVGASPHVIAKEVRITFTQCVSQRTLSSPVFSENRGIKHLNFVTVLVAIRLLI